MFVNLNNTLKDVRGLAGNSLDVEQNTAFDILDYTLLSAPGAPLKQALLDAGMGKDIMGSYEDGIYQPFFSIVAKNADPKKKDEFVALIRSTLEEIVKKGIDKKASKCRKSGNNASVKRRIGQENRGDKKELISYTW